MLCQCMHMFAFSQMDLHIIYDGWKQVVYIADVSHNVQI